MATIITSWALDMYVKQLEYSAHTRSMTHITIEAILRYTQILPCIQGSLQ